MEKVHWKQCQIVVEVFSLTIAREWREPVLQTTNTHSVNILSLTGWSQVSLTGLLNALDGVVAR